MKTMYSLLGAGFLNVWLVVAGGATDIPINLKTFHADSTVTVSADGVSAELREDVNYASVTCPMIRCWGTVASRFPPD